MGDSLVSRLPPPGRELAARDCDQLPPQWMRPSERSFPSADSITGYGPVHETVLPVHRGLR